MTAAHTAALPLNLMQFVRLLRRIGMPIGAGRLVLAIEALQLIDIGRREDVYWALHAILVDRQSQSELFQLAFARFWQAQRANAEELPAPTNADRLPQELKAAPRRVDDAFRRRRHAEPFAGDTETAQLTWSAAERLRQQDFETMSSAELADARRLIGLLRLPLPSVPTRRFRTGDRGARVDMRKTFRAMVRAGGVIDLKRRRRLFRAPPLVVLCDISGSMAAYSRMLLHFLHAVTNARDRVHVFLFGTRLTNVTRDMTRRDPDEALARVTRAVKDWSGGTRIGETLATFNRLWARRVLGQGAVVLLITDGLDRDEAQGLAQEMERLRRACRRLIWLNPLLRFSAFEPKPAGIRAMLPYVDDFRPVHNLDSLASLIDALSENTRTRRAA
jgi:uncharacterized protein with von Willebrand factor type A (vWA) domain